MIDDILLAVLAAVGFGFALALVYIGLILFRRKFKPPEMLPHTIVKDWESTGRIDICFPDITDGLHQGDDENPTVCQLMCEDRRTVTSMTESEHLEIRWRRATPKEARDLVIFYHKAKVDDNEHWFYRYPIRNDLTTESRSPPNTQ